MKINSTKGLLRSFTIPARNVFFIVVLLIAGRSAGKAQSQGPNNPATASYSGMVCLSCPGALWIGFPNIKVADGVLAKSPLQPFDSCSPGVGTIKCYVSSGLLASNYGFSIPRNATITGIQVDVIANAWQGGAIKDSDVHLQLNNGLVTLGNNHAIHSLLGANSQDITYGGPGDLWGADSLTPAIIDSAVFGVFYKVFNSSNAVDTAYVDNINVTVFYALSGTPPVAAFTASDTVICAGDSVQFTDKSIGIALFDLPSWTFPGGTPDTSDTPNPVVTYSTPGQYSVSIRVYNNSGTDSLTKTNYITVNPLPSTPGITNSGDTLYSSSATGNQWFKNDSLLAGADSSIYIATDSGSYTVVVTAAGCNASSAPFPFIPTGIQPLLWSQGAFNIFPNPTKGSFAIHLNAVNSAASFMRISDISGKIVELKNVNIVPGKNTWSMNLDNIMPAGMYIIELEANHQVSRQKLVVIE